MTIGIIGQGFVGNAVREKMQKYYSVFYYDKDPNKKSNVESIYKLQEVANVVFVCVPTPMKKTGECDVSIIEEILSELDVYKSNVIIKSTIPPGTTDRFIREYPNLSIAFNPEFLTEANAVEDYNNQKRIIIGLREGVMLFSSVFENAFPDSKIIICDPMVAEMVKYVTNTFLATKVSYANEISHICSVMGIDYDDVISVATKDERLGTSHWKVPGHDGDYGYGGHCLPKDISALKFIANKNGATTSMLDATINKNNEVRKNRDWEKQIGRAVSA
jgi:UDPglucose 6-dehydrogenase